MANPDSDWVDEADWKDEAGPTGHPNPDAKSNPVSPERSLLDRYFNPQGHGRAGGFIGGALGGAAGGIPGIVLGAGLGNLAGQSPGLSPEQQGLRPPGLAAMARGSLADSRRASSVPPQSDYKPDYLAAGADAATQGVFGLGLKGLGYGAVKLGFPRVGGLLGATTPQAAVLKTAPQGVEAISTPTLRTIDTVGAEQGPAAAKAWGATEAELARQELLMARLAEKAKGSMGGIQSRMAARDSAELLPKTQAFSESLDAAGIPEDVRRAAFADAPSVEEAAINPGVRTARQDMVTAAVPQRADANALKNATRFIANAEARGVTGPSSKYAGEASGLTQLTGVPQGNNEWLKGVAERAKLPGPMSQAASAILPKGGLSPDRVAQTTAALLGNRGEQTINPVLAKLISDNPAYRASPSAQMSTEALRQLLDALQRR